MLWKSLLMWNCLLIIDNKLTFQKYITKLSQPVLYKLHALRRIRKYLTLEKFLGNVLVDSQFNYPPLISMFWKKTTYFKMQKIHYKTLRNKSVPKLNPKFMCPYCKNLLYNARKGPSLSLPSTKPTAYGANSVHFKATLIWNNRPCFVKSSASVFEFKRNLKTSGSIDCSCLILLQLILYNSIVVAFINYG